TGAVVSGVEEVTEWLPSHRADHKLYTRLFKSTAQPPLATLTLVHGIGEHVDRYESVARSFARSGIQVLCFDQQGFGKTGHRNGNLGDNGGPNCVIEDIALMNKHASIQGVPHFLFGHSMGGLNALRYCLERNHDGHVRGVVASAPALLPGKTITPPKLLVFLLKQVVKVAPGMTKKTDITMDMMTSNKEEVERFNASKYNLDYSTLRTLNTIVTAGEEVSRRAPEFSTPVFLVHGEGDQITDCEATCKFFEGLPEGLDKDIRVIEGCNYHEIHFEQDLGFDLFDAYQTWIIRR
ncbi:alpha/beta-hydrolase, partial [Martensiomyces pterosporus]